MLSPAVEAFRARSTPILERARPYWLAPWTPLAILALLQWALVLRLALSAEHNRWLYYQGGDQTFLYGSAWVVSQGHIPDSAVGYVWPMLMAPLAAVAGPNFLSALPGLILFQTLVLLPLGLLAIYGAGARLGGRRIGYLAASVWVLAPHLSTSLFVERYHDKWHDLSLPQMLGLTGMGDFPSMIVLAGAAYFFLRLLDEGSDVDAALTAALVGLAIGLKPANVLILGGIVPALVLARRWRGALLLAAFLLPALLTLTLWKARGLGYVPIFAASPVVVVAAAATVPGLRPAPLASISTYLHLDWDAYGQTITHLREFFWSRRLLEFLPFAGLVGAARASFAKAAFLGGWFFAFFLIKTPRGSVEDTSFWRLLTPSWPAFLLLMCALPLLVPGLGERLARSSRTTLERPRRGFTRPIIAALVAAMALPLLGVLALTPLKDAAAARLEDNDLYVTHDSSIELKADQEAAAVRLNWKGGTTGNAETFYRILRVKPRSPVLQGAPPFPHATDGLLCFQRPEDGLFVPIELARCSLHMEEIASTRETTFVDHPAKGTWVYRVEVAANWLDDESKGDPFTFSAPARVTVR